MVYADIVSGKWSYDCPVCIGVLMYTFASAELLIFTSSIY